MANCGPSCSVSGLAFPYREQSRRKHCPPAFRKRGATVHFSQFAFGCEPEMRTHPALFGHASCYLACCPNFEHQKMMASMPRKNYAAKKIINARNRRGNSTATKD